MLKDRIATLEALVERQAAVIVEKDAVIERLQLRVLELERRLGERTGGEPPGTAGGGGARREPSGRKPGGQPGHKGHRRDLLPPERMTRTVDCFPDACRGCGKALRHTPDASPHRHQFIDILLVAPDVTAFRQHHVTCACGVTTCGALPSGAPMGLLGLRLLAPVVILTASCHVSRRKKCRRCCATSSTSTSRRAR